MQNNAKRKQKLNSRNREETSQRLINSVGDLIADGGFSNIGVNALARQAGVDKVLIYRYFGGLEGLYRAYAYSANFWPTVSELVGVAEEYELLKRLPFAKAASIISKRYLKAIRSRPLTLEILAWETVQRNSLTIVLEESRQAMGNELISRLEDFDIPAADWPAIINVFTGAIHYLLIRSRKINSFGGMGLSREEDWVRIEEAIEFLWHAAARNPKIKSLPK